MIENNHLEASLCTDDFASYDLKYRSNSGDILVSRTSGGGAVSITLEPAWKIDLARLIEDQEARHGVVNVIEKEALESQRDRKVVG